MGRVRLKDTECNHFHIPDNEVREGISRASPAFSGSEVLEVLRLTEFPNSPWTRTLRDLSRSAYFLFK
jgi:hypothetical protein